MALYQSLALVFLCAALVAAEDPVAALSRLMERGQVQLSFDTRYGYLPALLNALRVPVESQMAVFSKTSIQSMRIFPANPRVLYFNDSVAVGWVRSGFIELAAQDPGNRIHFYALMQHPNERIHERSDCLNCHKAGTRLRSVEPAIDGVPLRGETLAAENDVDSRTPFSRLWGGWFVTGAAVPFGHMGNAVFEKSVRRELTPALDPKVALTASSDIVALMVFAHQMHMMNLLANPYNVNELVDYLLFVDEAPLPDPIRRDSAFAAKFSAAGPADRIGRSLRQFDLEHRLIRYSCSYMIYTDAFDALPATTKDAIYRRMWRVLSGQLDSESDRYRRMPKAARDATIEILRDTKKDLPVWFGDSTTGDR